MVIVYGKVIFDMALLIVPKILFNYFESKWNYKNASFHEANLMITIW